MGLESGSESQLKRHKAKFNFKAVDLARELGINVEIGFIPLDAFMADGSWRDEMRENLRLARHCDVAQRSPTWLAPTRVYRESPLLRWIEKRGLLGEQVDETGEFSFRYGSAEVRQFVQDMGPCLCAGANNGLYRFKRELKHIQRYPVSLLEVRAPLGEHIIHLELDFIERLLEVETRDDVARAQAGFTEQAVNALRDLVQLLEHTPLPHASLLGRCAEGAIETLLEWSGVSLAAPGQMDAGFPALLAG